MKLTTSQFGEVEFSDEKIIKFNDGLFGFEEYTDFLLISEEEGIFYWLTSIDEPELIFPLFPTRMLVELEEPGQNFEVFSIATLDRDPSKITVNLKAPVYLNQKERLGYQKIIDNENFPVDYNLFVEN